VAGSITIGVMNICGTWLKRILYVGIGGLAISVVAAGLLEALIRGWIALSPVAWIMAWGLVITSWLCLVAIVCLLAWALMLKCKG
jgi:hypothetical protein